MKSDSTRSMEVTTPDKQRTKPGEAKEERSFTQPAHTTNSDNQQQQLKKPRKKRGSLAAVGRSFAKGPRMLGRRIKHFLKDDMHMGVSFQKMPATNTSRELATMELLAIYHRWLRGVQAALSIIVFVLSLMSIPNAATVVNWTIFIISQLTILVICKTYEVKAHFSGLTNVLFKGKNIFTSPFFFEMVAEIILWNIQTPPIVVFWKSFMNLINYFIFLRLYSVVLYLNNAAYVYRTFCRAMEAMSDLPLSTSFLIRTALVYHRYRVALVSLFTAWLTIGFMFAKAETVSVSTGMWFSFQALTTLGYGDATPITLAGRAVVILSGLCSFFLIAYVIVCAQASILATDAEYNMQVLARCHDLTHTLRNRSAWVIQIAWKFHRFRKQSALTPTKKAKLKVLLVSVWLTHAIAFLRRTRQNLRAAQRDFRETNVNPLTGLSSYQYTTYVYETHKAARRLQRVKDVDRVYLALKDRDITASSLSRNDIASIIMPHGAHALDEETGPFSGHATFLRHRQLSGSAASLESWTVPKEPPCSYSGAQQAAATTVDIKAWEDRVDSLEAKCGQLASLLDAMAASAATHPPSMAISQL